MGVIIQGATSTLQGFLVPVSQCATDHSHIRRLAAGNERRQSRPLRTANSRVAGREADPLRYVWLAMWDGTSWAYQSTVTTSTTGTNRPAVAVAFEASSGQALAVYGEATTAPRYRTWALGVGWSAEFSAPNIGATSNSMMLFPGSGTDGIMLTVQDDDSDLHWIHWNGNSWGPDNELETDSGETKNQPFLFL